MLSILGSQFTFIYNQTIYLSCSRYASWLHDCGFSIFHINSLNCSILILTLPNTYIFRYVYAKTTQSGLTSFYALSLDSEEQSAEFEYRHEGLEQGFRTLPLREVNVADGRFHHIATSVYGNAFALYIDGQLHGSPPMLIAALEDGSGVLYLGHRQANTSRFSGTYANIHSVHLHTASFFITMNISAHYYS